VTINRVLAIGAHPDDVEILCGGTMARYACAGAAVTICSITNGDPDAVAEGSATARARAEEARRAASLIDAAFISLGFRDGDLDAGDRCARERLIEVVCQVSPDVVFTHYPNDYHPDHVAASALVLAATYMNANVPPVFYMDTLAGVGVAPEDYVDVTGVYQLKLNMVREHQSQLDRDGQDLDFIDLVETTAKFRGYQCGVRYAEAFCPVRRWLRQTPAVLLPA
jgi:LmbE family N-acetylglucosaminyl deacetylase